MTQFGLYPYCPGELHHPRNVKSFQKAVINNCNGLATFVSSTFPEKHIFCTTANFRCSVRKHPAYLTYLDGKYYVQSLIANCGSRAGCKH